MSRILQNLFVDRVRQSDAFRKMLDGESRRRIMVLKAGQGMGKSWLLHIFAHEAKNRQLPLVQIDFSDRQPYDPLMLARRCRDSLGPEHFNPLTEMINQATSSHITLGISGSTSAGPINISIGSENVLTDSTISVSEVGNTIIKDNFFRIDTDNPLTRQVIEDRITVGFFDCLTHLCSRTTTVFLFDSYERNSLRSGSWIARIADNWIHGQLLARIRDRRLDNIVVVIAGRQTPAFGLEWDDVLGQMTLDVFTAKDVSEYLRERRGLSALTEAEITRLHQAIEGDPQMLGLIGRNLERGNWAAAADEVW